MEYKKIAKACRKSGNPIFILAGALAEENAKDELRLYCNNYSTSDKDIIILRMAKRNLKIRSLVNGLEGIKRYL